MKWFGNKRFVKHSSHAFILGSV